MNSLNIYYSILWKMKTTFLVYKKIITSFFDLGGWGKTDTYWTRGETRKERLSLCIGYDL